MNVPFQACTEVRVADEVVGQDENRLTLHHKLIKTRANSCHPSLNELNQSIRHSQQSYQP